MQSFRLEFTEPNGCHTFLVGDRERCENFLTTLRRKYYLKADFHSCNGKCRELDFFRSLSSEMCPLIWITGIQKKVNGKSRSRDIFCWIEIRLKEHCNPQAQLFNRKYIACPIYFRTMHARQIKPCIKKVLCENAVNGAIDYQDSKVM